MDTQNRINLDNKLPSGTLRKLIRKAYPKLSEASITKKRQQWLSGTEDIQISSRVAKHLEELEKLNKMIAEFSS